VIVSGVSLILVGVLLVFTAIYLCRFICNYTRCPRNLKRNDLAFFFKLYRIVIFMTNELSMII
jgi:hypothetical protein